MAENKAILERIQQRFSYVLSDAVHGAQQCVSQTTARTSWQRYVPPEAYWQVPCRLSGLEILQSPRFDRC